MCLDHKTGAIACAKEYFWIKMIAYFLDVLLRSSQPVQDEIVILPEMTAGKYILLPVVIISSNDSS